MLLLRDLNEEVQILEEGVGKEKSYYIEGPFLITNEVNKNKRLYEMTVVRPEVKRYTAEYIDQKRAFGELGHPAGPTINLERVSHMITSLKEDGNRFIGRAKIMGDLPYGAIAKGFINEGAKLGISSRGMGSMKLNNEGVNVVQRDYFLATAGDLVADPSGPGAFVQGIMEGREWMYLDGKWMEKDNEAAKKLVESTNRRQLAEVQFRVFEDFMHKISAKSSRNAV